MNTEEELLEKIKKTQNSFYENNSKHMLFKTKQKQQCATFVASAIDIQELMQKTTYFIIGTNCIVFDYTVFKTYATPSNYDQIVAHAIHHFLAAIRQFGSYQVHVNLAGCTVSAVERHKHIFAILCEKCMDFDSSYISSHLDKLCVYYTPSCMSMILQILQIFMEPTVRTKICTYSKEESETKMWELFSKANHINTIQENIP